LWLKFGDEEVNSFAAFSRKDPDFTMNRGVTQSSLHSGWKDRALSSVSTALGKLLLLGLGLAHS
jgi:hypothetical protein